MPLYLNDQGQWVDDEYGPAPGAIPTNQWTGSQSNWDAFNNPANKKWYLNDQGQWVQDTYWQWDSGAALDPVMPTAGRYGGSATGLKSIVDQMNQQYGLTNQDWDKGINAYYNSTGTTPHDAKWWGDAASTRAYLTGIGLSDPRFKDTFQTYLAANPNFAALEQQQQRDAAINGQQMQANEDPDFDLGQLTPFIVAAGAAGLGASGLFGGAGGAAGGASSLPSALSGAGTFEAGLGSTLGGNAGLGISQGLGASAGGVLGGAGSFADIAAGGMLGGIGGAAGIGALPSIAAEGAAIGGVGSVPPGTTTATGGAGGGSGNMDYLDLLSEGTNTVPEIPTGTNPYGTDLGLPPGTLPDGSIDVGPSWVNQLQAAISGVPNLPPGVSQLLKTLGVGGGAAGAGTSSLLGLLGKGIGGVLDYSASSKAADNAKAIADRTWGAGQLYRDNAARAMSPGFDLNSIPGYSGALSNSMDAFNRSLSAKSGNPWGVGGAAGEAISYAGRNLALPAWQNYFNANSNAGGLSNLATQSTTAGLNAGAADAATYGSLGQTARNIFDPQPNYQKQYLDLLGKQYGLA